MGKTFRCVSCRNGICTKSTYPATGTVKWENQNIQYNIPELPCYKCGSCHEVYLSSGDDYPIFDQVRAKLGLLLASEIRQNLDALGWTQNELAEKIGTTEETVSRWCTNDKIQSLMADQALRTLFAHHKLIRVLCEIERRTRPEGDMADQAVNNLITSAIADVLVTRTHHGGAGNS